MIQNYQIFTAIVASFFFIVVISLIRKDSILIGAALRWLIISACIVILGFYPSIIDYIAKGLGVAYGPVIPLILCCLFLLLKMLLADIQRARLELKISRMAQKMAIIEAKLEGKIKD
jgi:hypothetical protein